METVAKEKPARKPKSKEPKESALTVNTPTEVVQVDHEPAQVSAIANMITTALSSGRSMEEIEKLIKFRNDEIARLAEIEYTSAMAKFKKECPPISKNKLVDQGTSSEGKQRPKYKFAELWHVAEVIGVHLTNNGFTWSWKPHYEGDWIYITCIMAHIGGHKEERTLRGKSDVGAGKNAIQADISTVSYLHRVTLLQASGMATGDQDNDGANHGKGATNEEVAKKKATAKNPPTNEEFNGLLKRLHDTMKKGAVDEERVRSSFDSLNLTEEQREAMEIALKG